MMKKIIQKTKYSKACLTMQIHIHILCLIALDKHALLGIIQSTAYAQARTNDLTLKWSSSRGTNWNQQYQGGINTSSRRTAANISSLNITYSNNDMSPFKVIPIQGSTPQITSMVLHSRYAYYNTTLIKMRNDKVTDLLDSLVTKYDKSLRPNMGGSPATVRINMQVRSMGPISEIDMTYSMDCYLRQSWVDKRLAFSGKHKSLALGIDLLRKIWKPDTYIYNGMRSYLHTVTTPNKFVRLFPSGVVLFSQRLTIRAHCPMDLTDFPMDRQQCPLRVGSFGYPTNDVIYEWVKSGKKFDNGVLIAENMKLSQFDLIEVPTDNITTIMNKEPRSALLIEFILKRRMGNFIIQVYGPCILLVVISWVSFWLNREATSDRISLGITTCLTMTFLGLEVRTDLPQVSYPTAIDYYVFFSFMFIFFAVVQTAFVHWFTKRGTGDSYYWETDDEPGLDGRHRKKKPKPAPKENSWKRMSVMWKTRIGQISSKRFRRRHLRNMHCNNIVHCDGTPEGRLKCQVVSHNCDLDEITTDLSHNVSLYEKKISFPDAKLENRVPDDGAGHNQLPISQTLPRDPSTPVMDSEMDIPSVLKFSNDIDQKPACWIKTKHRENIEKCCLNLNPYAKGVMESRTDSKNASSSTEEEVKEDNSLSTETENDMWRRHVIYSVSTLKGSKADKLNDTRLRSQPVSLDRHTIDRRSKEPLSSSTENRNSKMSKHVWERNSYRANRSKRSSSVPISATKIRNKRKHSFAIRDHNVESTVNNARSIPKDVALNSLSKIDRLSRIFFPLSFFLLNVAYWYYYLKKSEKIELIFESS